jgi:tetratricopeptide (TPR) repeat protein
MNWLVMKRLLVVSVGLAALMVGVIGAWYAVRQEREFQRLVAAGDAALAEDSTYRAIEAFSGALALKDDSMLAHLRRGSAYRRRGELAAALRDLRQATSLDPAAPDPIELSGDVNMALGRYERAAEDYRAFTRLDDQSPRVLYKLALAYYQNQQAGQAIAPLREAVTLDPRLAEAHYLLGLCLRERSEVDEALLALNRALEINPAFATVREELADLYNDAGRRREAIDQLEALSALEPSRVDRMVNVGLAYADWGRTQSAILALSRAAERYPDESTVRVALGRVWLQAAEREDDPAALGKALEALQIVASSTGASANTLTLYGRALLLADRPGEAERALAEAARRPPVDAAAFRYLADAAERLGHRSTAREALVRYVALLGEDEVGRPTLERLNRLQ